MPLVFKIQDPLYTIMSVISEGVWNEWRLTSLKTLACRLWTRCPRYCLRWTSASSSGNLISWTLFEFEERAPLTQWFIWTSEPCQARENQVGQAGSSRQSVEEDWKRNSWRFPFLSLDWRLHVAKFEQMHVYYEFKSYQGFFIKHF